MPTLEDLVGLKTEEVEKLLENNSEELLKLYAECFKLEPEAPPVEDDVSEDGDKDSAEGATVSEKPRKTAKKKASKKDELAEAMLAIDKYLMEKKARESGQQLNLTTDGNNNLNPNSSTT